MRSSLVPLGLWGLGVVALGVIGAVVFDLDALPTVLICLAGALAVLVAVADRLRPPAEAPTGPPRLLSAGATMTPAGVALVLVGIAAFGQAIWLLGAALTAAGVVAMVREGRR